MAAAPKSVAVYKAFGAARKLARETGSLPPPAHIRNAPTKLMKDLGYGKGYSYDPDTEAGFFRGQLFPRWNGSGGVLPTQGRGRGSARERNA